MHIRMPHHPRAHHITHQPGGSVLESKGCVLLSLRSGARKVEVVGGRISRLSRASRKAEVDDERSSRLSRETSRPAEAGGGGARSWLAGKLSAEG